MSQGPAQRPACTLSPPALPPGIAALPLPLQWPNHSPHPPDCVPAPEEATGNRENGLPGSISALEACSPWLWGNLRDELAAGEQVRGLQSSSGQCCCAFKDQHVMRSSASHCPPSSWPICHLGFSLYFISNGNTCRGDMVPRSPSSHGFYKNKEERGP